MPLPVPAEKFVTALAGLRALGVRGFNVTIPYKETVIPLLDRLDAGAAAVGAVNTVVDENGHWVGYNTDIDGFRAGLPAAAELHGTAAVIIGAGGAAKAVAAALAELPVGMLAVYDPAPGRAAALAGRVAERVPAAALKDRAALAAAVAAAALVVNASPLGMRADDPLPLAPEWLRPDAIYYDIVYHPDPTPMMQAAAARGCRVAGGREMLLQQGMRSFALWTQQPPPAAAMRAALQAALARA